MYRPLDQKYDPDMWFKSDLDFMFDFGSRRCFGSFGAIIARQKITLLNLDCEGVLVQIAFITRSSYPIFCRFLYRQGLADTPRKGDSEIQPIHS